MVAAGALKNGFYREPIALFMGGSPQGQAVADDDPVFVYIAGQAVA
jgi:hypothetical protein